MRVAGVIVFILGIITISTRKVFAKHTAENEIALLILGILEIVFGILTFLKLI